MKLLNEIIDFAKEMRHNTKALRGHATGNTPYERGYRDGLNIAIQKLNSVIDFTNTLKTIS